MCIFEGYARTLVNMLRGNFETAGIITPVTQKFTEVIWFSFVLGAVAFILRY